tara:strand:+ start:2774 stop:2977 length:204 start_codon:yes stop_codon:yes gene_type:complete
MIKKAIWQTDNMVNLCMEIPMPVYINRNDQILEWLEASMEKEMIDNHLNRLYTNTNYNRNSNDITNN